MLSAQLLDNATIPNADIECDVVTRTISSCYPAIALLNQWQITSLQYSFVQKNAISPLNRRVSSANINQCRPKLHLYAVAMQVFRFVGAHFENGFNFFLNTYCTVYSLLSTITISSDKVTK